MAWKSSRARLGFSMRERNAVCEALPLLLANSPTLRKGLRQARFGIGVFFPDNPYYQERFIEQSS